MFCLSHCFFLIFALYNVINAEVLDPMWDLPTENELHKYLETVEEIVAYYYRHNDEIDINAAFGLFLANVNLNHALKNKMGTIPQNVKDQIINITKDNNEILNAYENRMKFWKVNKVLEYLSLFNNASYFTDKIEKLVYNATTPGTSEELIKKFLPFDNYTSKVDNFHYWIPNPEISSACTKSLSQYSSNKGRDSTRCSLPGLCFHVVKNGTDFGYALTHRIFMLLLARFEPRCIFFSEHEDKELVKQLCSMAHEEATYIAENNFGLSDLMMEIIGLCTIDGHAQFLKRNWLDNLLKFQKPDGCYGAIPAYGAKQTEAQESFFLRNRNKFVNVLQDGCISHTSGVAALTFSAAVRFIMQE